MDNVKMNLVDKGDGANIYTITFKGEDYSEFEKFVMKFKDHAILQHDYQVIIAAMNIILKKGALERYFRPEGKWGDGVCALPIQTKRLRLYCIRMSDKILIAGNGGEKSVAKYQDSTELSGYVLDLQEFEKILKAELRKGEITLDTLEFGVDEKIF